MLSLCTLVGNISWCGQVYNHAWSLVQPVSFAARVEAMPPCLLVWLTACTSFSSDVSAVTAVLLTDPQ